MASYSDSADVATDETSRLIASNKVEGTAVYNREGERLGSIYNFMVDKMSGQVAYAVMSSAAFLESVTAITRCRGRASRMIRTWGAT